MVHFCVLYIFEQRWASQMLQARGNLLLTLSLDGPVF